MKYYNSYMNRQEISQESHERLLELTAQRRPARLPGRPWVKLGVLAACAALVAGAGMWRLIPTPHSAPDSSSAGQFAAGYTPLPGQTDTAGPEDHPLRADSSQANDAETGFVVSSPVESGKQMFPMIPFISYPEIDRALVYTSADRAYAPGSFTADLTKADIRTIFWGPEGKPEAIHPKTEQGDLPWMLFWDGYAVRGYAWYDGQGQLRELTIVGEKDRAEFELSLCPGSLPFNCGVIYADPRNEPSDVFGVSVAGWSRVYDRDGGGETDYICGSEFITEDGIGVRFENRNSLMQAEYGEAGDMDLGGAKTFNALFVRQAIAGRLYLDHLMTAENIPAWREEEFATLAQARQEVDFAPYLPAGEPEGFGSHAGNKEFYGRLSYQEGRQNTLLVRWSRGYDDVEVRVHRDGYHSYHLADPASPETYDLRLYTIPWSESVPPEYRDTVNFPAFKAEDMSLAIVEARGIEKDTGGLSFDFDVLHPDGTVVSYRCDRMTAQQVWEFVKETLT